MRALLIGGPRDGLLINAPPNANDILVPVEPIFNAYTEQDKLMNEPVKIAIYTKRTINFGSKILTGMTFFLFTSES